MSPLPDTRISLILRLATPDDVEAWRDFADAYVPAIYRLARQRGLQDADAQDLVQELLLAVAQVASRWEPDSNRARFGTWLYRVAMNLFADRFRDLARRPFQPENGESIELLLACDGSLPFEDEFELEFRRSVFQKAAQAVQQRVDDATWRAFAMTSLEKIPVAATALQLGMSHGAIYVARSRVMKLLREETARLMKQLADHDQLAPDPADIHLASKIGDKP